MSKRKKKKNRERKQKENWEEEKNTAKKVKILLLRLDSQLLRYSTYYNRNGDMNECSLCSNLQASTKNRIFLAQRV